MTNTNVVDFTSTKNVKEFIETAQLQIQKLEHALYQIMETKSLEAAKELAADALDEDLDTYLEEDDLEELDFENKLYPEDIIEVELENE